MGKVRTFTMKSGLVCQSFWSITCLYGLVSGVRDSGEVDVFINGVGDVDVRGLGSPP